MRHILIFGGTTEGRVLAQKLVQAGCVVTVSVATELGREELAGISPLTVLTGRRSRGQMEALLQGIELCIDATHPYATQVSAEISAACAKTGVPLHRLLRPRSAQQADWVFSTPQQAAAYLQNTAGNILLTVGTKSLSAFSLLEPGRLFVRTLPTHEAIDACEALGLPHRNIIALQGPFSKELNLALLRQYEIKWMVTKDGGAAGGYREKQEAAQEAGVNILLLRRPEEQGMSMEALLQEVLSPQ